jgi:site-specific DNA-methyltransferase (adenine-specific)
MAMPHNCISNHLPDKIADLGIYDPPFGISEASFGKHYNRDDSLTIDGYVEAPEDYYTFTTAWMLEAARVLKPNGSIYIISGWSHSDIIGRVIRDLGLFLINKIIWNFPFGVYAKKKYVTSHYEIFYVKKNKKAKPTFNTFCRFEKDEIDAVGGKLNYQDRESVWRINKEIHSAEKGKRNKNKLPEALIKKIIQYSSNEGDVVCDFFMGNFTTKKVCQQLNRHCIGFEINENAFVNGVIREANR